MGVEEVGEKVGTPVTCWQLLGPILIGGLLPHPPMPTTPHVLEQSMETVFFFYYYFFAAQKSFNIFSLRGFAIE